MLLSSPRFQQVLGMTSCPKIKTCHPDCIDEVASERPGSGINEMVIYRFHYVTGQQLGAFPVPSHVFRSCSKDSLLSSTEV
jgi:hypothetical protein